MNSESNSIASARKKCAKQFAAWLMHSPELETWEDRKDLAQELNRVSDRLEREGRTVTPFLPNLQSKTEAVMDKLAAWTEAAMKELNISPPEWGKNQTPLERAQEIVEILSQAAIPLEPSEFR